MGKNIEIKARCDDLSKARELARKLGALQQAVLWQTDTYFRVNHGRLKLRQITGDQRRAELIWYDRDDRKTARPSNYCLMPVEEPAALRAALQAAMGVWKVVRKRRELWMHRNVRIHLDRVDRLGEFIELEAVVGGRYGLTDSRANLRRVQRALQITSKMLVSGSYSDL